MRPLLQPNVEIMIATAMMYSPALPRIASSAAVPTRSCGAVAVASAGRTVREATVAGRYSAVTVRSPTAIADGGGRLAALGSLPAKPAAVPARLAESEAP